jgi:hypothetical protein
MQKEIKTDNTNSANSGNDKPTIKFSVIEEIEEETIPQLNKKDNQARDWVFVVNNPTQTDEELFEYLKTLVNVRYFVFCKEIGDNGTEHHQGYIEFSAPKRFSTIKKYFSEESIGVNAHIETRYGKRADCVNYVKKIGKFKDKAYTQIGEVFEFGTFSEGGERNDLADIVEMIENNATDEEIRISYPSQYFRYYRNIENIREKYIMQKYLRYENENRPLHITYIWGAAGSGKTRYVMEKHGSGNVFRMTNYGRYGEEKFDGYKCQDVMVFEEFRSGIRMTNMLSYLDIYPLELPARFRNKQACYTKVYLISNIPLNEQYAKIQETEPETWRAFLRRIHEVKQFPLPKPKTAELPDLSNAKNMSIADMLATMGKPIDPPHGNVFGDSDNNDNNGDLPY